MQSLAYWLEAHAQSFIRSAAKKMESDLIIEEGDSVERPALPIEHLVPLEQNQRRNRYGSIVCYKSEAEVNIEGDEESNSVRSL